jgi:cyclophilin family peptidyl-prolyl cis-trans isomerase
MLKKVYLAVFMIAIAFALSCNQNSPPKKTSSANAEVKKGVTPIADREVAVIEMEKPVYGKFTIELYSNLAPEMVKRFKELANEGFYNGTAIHRINPSVIQGGDPLSKEGDSPAVGSGSSKKPNVVAEFSDVPYDTGIVGAARTQDVNTQNCQFFVTLKREPAFDNKYTIFGKVIDGMNNVRTIAGAPRDGEKPLDAIRIKSVTIQTKQ